MSLREINKTILCMSGNSFAMNTILCILILKREAACAEALLSNQTEHLSDGSLGTLYSNVYTLVVLNFCLCGTSNE
jgi:hypothetical protein